MIRKYVLPLLAVVGILLAVGAVERTNRAVVPAPPVAEPARSPYETFVAGAGVVEANTRDIAIGTSVAGIVTTVDVIEGDEVRAGDRLFQIDDRSAKANLEVRQTEVRVAQSLLADAKNQLALAESVRDRRAISVEELDRRRFAMEAAEARVAQARAVAEAAATDLELLTVHAPVAGEVLQVNVRVGEYASATTLATPLMVLGNVDPLYVRVDVDETDAWRVVPGAPAIAVLRGNPDIKTDLVFVRFEPYVVPKRSLTGESTEIVDTRVLQVLYSFRPGKVPIYVGQQMDVYIEAPPHAEGEPS